MSTTSAALLPLCSPEVNGSTGMPRPSSSTWQPPSAQQGDVDAGAVAGHRLVDGVVDDLPDQVVQALQAGGADVHARALADRVEALEDLDVLGVVGRRRGGGVGAFDFFLAAVPSVGVGNVGRW